MQEGCCWLVIETLSSTHHPPRSPYTLISSILHPSISFVAPSSERLAILNLRATRVHHCSGGLEFAALIYYCLLRSLFFGVSLSSLILWMVLYSENQMFLPYGAVMTLVILPGPQPENSIFFGLMNLQN